MPAALLLLGGIGSAQQALPPPPENPGETPTPAPVPSRPKLVTCPRCGYMCDPGWHYCVACGWDLTALEGEAEERRLQSVARATLGVTTMVGRRKRFATAFPFGGPGLFLTNARVLVGSDESFMKVRNFMNREYSASIVGYDLPSGVGLLKAAIPDVPLLETAPTSPSPPQSSWAVCYPIVLEDDVVRYLPVSLHRGKVTATGQSGTFLVSFESLLRTDHAIEEGCTGGPLIDSRGRLAGMILGSPDNGITYASPLEGLQAVVASLSHHERAVRPFFGFGLVMPDDRRRAKFGIETREAHPMIAYLIPGSPAADAGVRSGDLLKAVGGQTIATVREAGERLLAAAPGSADVALTLERGGGERHVSVRPMQRPERIMLDPADEIQETLEANLKEVASGAGGHPGLVVADLVRGGRGEKARYKNGDIIVGVDKKSIKSFETFDDVIRSSYREIFSNDVSIDRRFGSSYVLKLEVRPEGQDKVTREYVNMFPDFLAPPVY